MYLESRDIVNQPIGRVFPFVRDELPRVVPYLPNISKIEVIERTTQPDGRIHIVNVWHAKAEIPAIAKKIIKPEILSWKDIATWDNSARRVEYRLESNLAKDLFDAKGINEFKDLGNGQTEMKISCEVTLHADKIPGIPSFLLRGILPHIEGFIKVLLEPNLTSLAKGLNRFFTESQGVARNLP